MGLKSPKNTTKSPGNIRIYNKTRIHRKDGGEREDEDACIEKALEFLKNSNRDFTLKQEQRQAVEDLLRGADVLAILPTGFAEKMLEEILEMVRVKKVTVDNNTVSFDYQYLPVEERGRQRRKRKHDGQPISKVYVETKKVTLDEKTTIERVGRKGEFSYPAEWYYRVCETNQGFKAPTRDVVLAYEFWIENRDVHDCNIPKKFRKAFEESSKWEVGNGGVGGEAADKQDKEEEEKADVEQSCGVPANRTGGYF
ncbi:hypothetical protein QZH41_002293 [Actinostola sp. cb2023]|nr:hypothetical protein QZH41_002293 [Actinostola sp. cb2023]